MSESTLTSSSAPDPGAAVTRRTGFSARYRLDHRNPINHFLHVGVGWPMAAISVILLPFRPLWGLGLFLSAYAIMFLGHFVFERNIPTLFKQPGTPFVIAYDVVRGLAGGLARLAMQQRVR